MEENKINSWTLSRREYEREYRRKNRDKIREIKRRCRQRKKEREQELKQAGFTSSKSYKVGDIISTKDGLVKIIRHGH